MIAISLDDNRDALDKYLEEAKLPWPVIHDSAPELADKLQMKFGIASLPTVLFLNKEGVVVSLEARGAELDRLMERLFEMPTRPSPNRKPDQVKAALRKQLTKLRQTTDKTTDKATADKAGAAAPDKTP